MFSRTRISSLAWAALAGSGMLYGYNWVVMKSALKHESSAVFAASRVFPGAVLLRERRVARAETTEADVQPVSVAEQGAAEGAEIA
ncbi:MAG: hypothetical protein M1389_09045 [Chloroflexi bacterium]|nr:hypothetical protein [Chloroflexota bacterium]MCL5735878.1 hypothetical protein [Actinomycetota bacterium]